MEVETLIADTNTDNSSQGLPMPGQAGGVDAKGFLDKLGTVNGDLTVVHKVDWQSIIPVVIAVMLTMALINFLIKKFA